MFDSQVLHVTVRATAMVVVMAVTAALMGQRCVDIMVAHEHQLLLFVHAFCVICSRLRVLTELQY